MPTEVDRRTYLGMTEWLECTNAGASKNDFQKQRIAGGRGAAELLRFMIYVPFS
jgi:hypothetical protein